MTDGCSGQCRTEDDLPLALSSLCALLSFCVRLLPLWPIQTSAEATELSIHLSARRDLLLCKL